MDALSTSTSTPKGSSTLSTSIDKLLSNNFDASSIECIVTLIKMIDNIVKKPTESKVRCIRLLNPNFHSKVGSKVGSVDILVSIGFEISNTDNIHDDDIDDENESNQERQRQGGTISLSPFETATAADKNAAPAEPSFLILRPSREDTNILIQARHKLAQIATRTLNCPSNKIPKFIPPTIMKVPTTTSATSAAATSAISTGSFNIYQGRRHDGQSAAVGTNLGPPENYKSITDQKLEVLQKKQLQLEQKLQKQNQVQQQQSSSNNRDGTTMLDRQWTRHDPNATTTSNAAADESMTTTTTPSAFSTGKSSSSDSALLAGHIQKQMQQRQQEQNRGFTTRAMREVERLKKQRVYSHTVLVIAIPQPQFPSLAAASAAASSSSVILLRGNFLPKENIQSVIDSLQRQVFLTTAPDMYLPTSSFELYTTPPRTVISPPTSTSKATKGKVRRTQQQQSPLPTLQELGLVPAAKVYLSWKNNAQVGTIRPELLQWPTTATTSSSSASSSTVMPTSMVIDSVADDDDIDKEGGDGDKKKAGATTVPKKKKTRADKEAAMLRRMLGGGKK